MALQPYLATVPFKAFLEIKRFAVWQNDATNVVALRIILGANRVVNSSGNKTVSGVFQDQTGAGISRLGYAIDRSTGDLLATFTSSGTGAFSFNTPNTNPVIIVLVPNIGDSRNAVVLDNIVPI